MAKQKQAKEEPLTEPGAVVYLEPKADTLATLFEEVRAIPSGIREVEIAKEDILKSLDTVKISLRFIKHAQEEHEKSLK